ncbi:UDP-glucose 4-epimerase GalE [Ciceribacter sp. L1K23]|uniref:UDP-glucose 4-epimerase GalE n=1 Tax=unclassified Ciceribacter TaxID=2628820 RepID=UPI001ABDD5D6|nr:MULTISPECIES: UDP-glucose 4-epimerase GalE [unclassified Ciceribacter]MBO3758432.1 UDP-glucose 4-epimerase GalE [Ciceribacter sp. L1K22]MBR0557244.1 UDP-glucose 4-epimerase GalE [Ciceribacter sp. L1K23]
MAILVTGGAGYIGSHMVWALLDQGHEVVVLDRLSTGFRWAVAPEARFYLGDVGNAEVLKQVFTENRIDSIIHFAGSIVVPDSVRDPLSYYENNTGNTRVLLSAAVEAGVGKFIFSSTAAVYGTPVSNAPVRETDLPRPENPYGASKLMSELMLQDTARAHDFRFVALRYFNVAGADLKGRVGQATRNATHLIKVACETALGERRAVHVFGGDYPTPDGTGVRDYIHVADLVSAHIDALSHLDRGGESLIANCGYGRGYSVLDVLRAVERVSGASLKVVHEQRRPGDAASVVADPTLARQRLGWRPRHDDLDGIIRTSLDWERRMRREEFQDIEALKRKLAALAS